MLLFNTSNLLSQIPFFAAMNSDAIQQIAFSGDRLVFDPGDLIFEAGQKSEGGHLVLAGRVDLFLPRRLDTPIHTVAAGGLIGELALLTPTERPVSAIAACACTTLKITRGAVWRVLYEFPDSAEALRREVVGRVRLLLNELASPHESLRRPIN